MSRKYKFYFLFLCFLLFIGFLTLEIGFRIYFAYKIENFKIFFYGISKDRLDVDSLFEPKNYPIQRRHGETAQDAKKKSEKFKFKYVHWDKIVSTSDPIQDIQSYQDYMYSKYRPYQEKYIKINKEKYRIHINNFGFRGKDFKQKKDEHVVRIITLGASSTFGYHDRDNETYPYYLEQILNKMLSYRRCDSVYSFEVINFGIPHLNSYNIYSLFMMEGLDLDPDIVTFYEGINDTRLIRRKFSERVLLALSEKLMFFRYLEQVLYYYFESFSPSDVKHHMKGRREFFLNNVSHIADECKKRDILFIALSQQAQSNYIPYQKMNTFTFDQERSLIQEEKLSSGDRLSLYELQFLIHADIMDGLRKWVKTDDILFVDMIKEMDENRKRGCLVSWVHLSPEGNRFIAKKLSEKIIDLVCL